MKYTPLEQCAALDRAHSLRVSFAQIFALPVMRSLTILHSGSFKTGPRATVLQNWYSVKQKLAKSLELFLTPPKNSCIIGEKLNACVFTFNLV